MKPREPSQPRSDMIASPKPDISYISITEADNANALDTYIDFLATSAKKYILRRDSVQDHLFPRMAAILDSAHLASPLAYNASQTALLLMDFQGLIVQQCGDGAQAAVEVAARMRDWAFKNHIMVIHSIVDVEGAPSMTCKRADRLKDRLTEFQNDKSACGEVPEIAFDQVENEYMVLKQPGAVSALKSVGAMELLREHGIKSLIMCGLATSGAVLRTALPATDEDFVVSVIEDGCADPSSSKHDIVMKSFLPSWAHVLAAEEFIDAWEGQTKK